MSQRTFDAFRGDAVPPRACLRNDAEIEAMVRESAESAYHPCGTCQIGEHPMSVVDPQCRVHGMEGLRVVDSAIMASILSESFNAPPTMMIGERASDMILARTPRPREESQASRAQRVDAVTLGRRQPCPLPPIHSPFTSKTTHPLSNHSTSAWEPSSAHPDNQDIAPYLSELGILEAPGRSCQAQPLGVASPVELARQSAANDTRLARPALRTPRLTG